jgi:ribosomal protein L9
VVIEAIKEVGTHTASVVLHKEVVAAVTVEVVAVGAEEAVAEAA